MPPATLLDFARANDAAAATTKKLQKQTTLAAYFKELPDDDLRLAVRYAAGHAFPPTTETTLNVGSAALWDVALSLLQIPHTQLRETTIRSGEIGEALSTLWPNRPSSSSHHNPLTLHDVAATFDDLSATNNARRKRDLLTNLFSQTTDPREPAYLAKIIAGDLRTGVQEGTLQAAVAQAFAKDLKQIQRTQLLVGDLEEVALLAKHDKLNDAKFTLFHPIQFMLATPQDSPAIAAATIANKPTGVVSSADHVPPPPPHYYAEDKLDGIRDQVHKSHDKIHIYTRTMDRTEDSFPDVVQQLQHLEGDLLLDGEIVPYKDNHVLPFSHLQKRLGRKSPTPKILRENPCRFLAFDLLYQNGTLLMDLPLSDRRTRLNAFSALPLPPSSILHPLSSPLLIIPTLQVTTEPEITTAFDAARARRNEGIILKDPASPYSPGRRGKSWLKLKTHLPTFDCVVTAAEYGHGKRRHVLSDYTFAVWTTDPTTDDDAKLVNIGKAFTGLTDAQIAEYTPIFLALSTSNNGRVHQVTPKIVVEIACDQIQRSDRHAGGYALRFPRIKRIRTDKLPQDADRLPRIAELYASQANFAQTTPPPPEPTLFDHL